MPFTFAVVVASFGGALYNFLGIQTALEIAAILLLISWIIFPLGQTIIYCSKLAFEYNSALSKLRVGMKTSGVEGKIDSLYAGHMAVPKFDRKSQIDRVFRIPLYPRFSLRPELEYLLAIPFFQRLSKIAQLSFAYRFYDGARHSRREHILGVCYLTGLACSRFRKTGVEEVDKDSGNFLDDRDVLLAEVLAILHDAFHPPFGHALDGLAKRTLEVPQGRSSGLAELKYDRWRLIQELTEAGFLRSALTEIDLTLDEIDMLIRVFRLNADDSAYMSKKSSKFFFFSYLLQSNYDIDRIDYLNRDALHTFGTVDVLDVFHLIQAISRRAASQGKLQYAESAADLLRNMDVQRFKNYAAVYESDESSAAEEMLCHAVYRLVRRHTLSSESEHKLYALTDDELFGLIHEYGGSYERWLADGAVRGRVFECVARYPANLAKTVVRRDSANNLVEIDFDALNDVFSISRIEDLQRIEKEKGIAAAAEEIEKFSKCLATLLRVLNPDREISAFQDKITREQSLGDRLASLRPQLTQEPQASYGKIGEDREELVFFLRHPKELPPVPDVQKQLSSPEEQVIRKRSGVAVGLSQYFGQTIMANPKLGALRVFAPPGAYPHQEEIKVQIESYLLETMLQF